MKSILFILGTRPEAIKLAPLIRLFLRTEGFTVKVCTTGQHREMLHQALNFFKIESDINLDLMQSNQTLEQLTAAALSGLSKVISECKPDFVVVQGDTTTAFAGALASFYAKVKIIHVEAGLRSQNKFSPYPEEINRVLIGKMADIHFAPTINAKENLLKEGISANSVWNVGNTVIDALFLGLDTIKNDLTIQEKFKFLSPEKKVILVTGHRRENFGNRFEEICRALKEIATKWSNVQIVYPVHLNPNVQEPVHRILSGQDNVFLIPPIEYPELIWVLNKSYMVITDSGGIQEEAPALGKPVLVMRDVTERIEGIAAGTALLVGTDINKIVSTTDSLLKDDVLYARMSKASNPFGDGTSCNQILEIISNHPNFMN